MYCKRLFLVQKHRNHQVGILICIILFLCLVGLFLYLRRKKKTAKEVLKVEALQVEESRNDDSNVSCDSSDSNDSCDLRVSNDSTGLSDSNESIGLSDLNDSSDKQVTQNKELIANLHKVLEEDKVFLQPEIHIDDVAKMLLTNRTYITRLMRQEYGLTFIEYVNVARIQYSQSLLYTSNMTLDEIAEKSGFQSTSNYCRAFKRYIGSTPLNWLQQVKPSR